MNNTRRKTIEAIVEKLQDIQTDLEMVAEEERDYYDNMPESLQSGERGERADEVASNLDESASSLGDLIDTLQESVS